MIPITTHKPVPSEEISNRINRFQSELRHHGIDLALIRQNADLYYFTGTVQDAHLLIPSQGPPLYLVWRVFEHARRQTPLENVRHLAGLSALPSILKKWELDRPATLGLEMDVLPAGLFLFYTNEIWPGAKTADVTHLIRRVRSIKSPWEIEQIKHACLKVRKVLDLVPSILRPGIRELDLAARVESELRRFGHPGCIRMRGWNQELGMGQILAGPGAAMPSWTNTPAGGTGVSNAFSMGAGTYEIQKGDPVSIDLGGYHNGYLCDQTRIFSVGKPSRIVEKSFSAILELQKLVEKMLVPGAVCQDIYEAAQQEMRVAGLDKWFMGREPDKVSFIGHGLGTEIDEYPFIARKNRMSLKPGMVVAVEPKLLIPEVGLVGIEDTYLVTRGKPERLTLGEQRLEIVDPPGK